MAHAVENVILSEDLSDDTTLLLDNLVGENHEGEVINQATISEKVTYDGDIHYEEQSSTKLEDRPAEKIRCSCGAEFPNTGTLEGHLQDKAEHEEGLIKEELAKAITGSQMYGFTADLDRATLGITWKNEQYNFWFYATPNYDGTDGIHFQIMSTLQDPELDGVDVTGTDIRGKKNPTVEEYLEAVRNFIEDVFLSADNWNRKEKGNETYVWYWDNDFTDFNLTIKEPYDEQKEIYEDGDDLYILRTHDGIQEIILDHDTDKKELRKRANVYMSNNPGGRGMVGYDQVVREESEYEPQGEPEFTTAYKVMRELDEDEQVVLKDEGGFVAVRQNEGMVDSIAPEDKEEVAEFLEEEGYEVKR